uniref:hypothetical protein n=1 Tax=Nocardioides alcanivorans TaxID=2897352 RepID=UPI001F175830|nr:hypothetical protein [Nocardioides alcanivorans]
MQYAVQDTTVNIGFSVAGREVTAEVDGERVDAVALHLSADVVDLEVAGIRRTYTVLAVDDVVHVHDADGMTTLGELSRFPAPDAGGMPGPRRHRCPAWSSTCWSARAASSRPETVWSCSRP